MLAWTLGRRDEAETRWRSALARNERAGARLRASRALAEAHGCAGIIALVDHTLAAIS